MKNGYEFDFTKLENWDFNRTELIAIAQDILESHPSPFGIVFGFKERKFVLAEGDERKILILPLEDKSSLLASRAMFVQEQQQMMNLIRGLNHNIRGPLSGIRSRLELLTRQLQQLPDPGIGNSVQFPIAKITDTFNKILRSADNMQQQLSDFEQVISWLDPEQETKMLLPGQVLETIRNYMISDLFVKRNVQVVIQPQPPVRSITINPALFVEPILRVLDNAVTALREKDGGKIQIGVSSSGSDCIVEIHNDGAKLPDQLADSFLYKPGAGSFPTGLGMGLAFSKRLVEASGGELFLLRNEESDVSFRLRYPRRP